MTEFAEEKETIKAIRKAEDLLKQRTNLMKLPPEKVMDKILDSPQPAPLVHSFPEEDFYLLVQEIGPHDCLSLLSLASNRQWEYMLDMEIWHRDRIAIDSATQWLDLFLKADPRRMVRWCVEEKLEFIEFYLFKSLEIVFLGQDQDPSDLGDGFFSLDGAIYVRTLDIGQKDKSEAGEMMSETRRQFIENFIHRLAEYDFIKYQMVLLESLHVLPAEEEEKAYRWRNVRLAEKGFLPFEDAVGVYQTLTIDQIEKMQMHLDRQGIDQNERQVQTFRSPRLSFELANGSDTFSQSLRMVSLPEIMPLLQTEFASLCNQLIAADQRVVRDRGQLSSVVAKACGYLSIGLDYLVSSQKSTATEMYASMLHRYPLVWIFRVGYGRGLHLKWKAEKWHTDSWFNNMGLTLTFWDETWMGVLGGLMLKKPLFFDNYETGVIYREFASTSDIEKTAKILDEIIVVDQLLSLMNLPEIQFAAGRLLTYKNLLLTLWARNYMDLSYQVEPVTIHEFGSFFDYLFERHNEPESQKTSIKMKASFLDWLSQQSGLTTNEISKRLGETLEALFMEIENEYGRVAKKDLDPRYMNLFLLEG